jgi:hypothetical protein
MERVLEARLLSNSARRVGGILRYSSGRGPTVIWDKIDSSGDHWVKVGAMRVFQSLVLTMLLVPGYAFAGDTFTRVVPQGKTRIATTLGTSSIDVEVTTHEMQIGKPSDPRPDVFDSTSSCTYSRYPCSIVDHIGIKVNGNRVFVPRSVFCDLADLGTAEIVESRKGFVLSLEGGDASEAYVVKIWFDAGSVNRRILWSATELKDPLQETIYHTVTEGN